MMVEEQAMADPLDLLSSVLAAWRTWTTRQREWVRAR